MYPTITGAKRHAAPAMYSPCVVECRRPDGEVGYITLPRGWPLSDIVATTTIIARKGARGWRDSVCGGCGHSRRAHGVGRGCYTCGADPTAQQTCDHWFVRKGFGR